MSSRIVVLALAATMLLTGCKSKNRELKPSRIGPSHQVTKQTSKYGDKGPAPRG